MVRSHRGRSSTEFISIRGECMVRNHRDFIELIFWGRSGLEAMHCVFYVLSLHSGCGV
jgi:hypothetical protein